MSKTLKPSTVIDTISLKIELKKELRELKKQGDLKKAQIVQLKIDFVEFVVAVVAEPQEAVSITLPSALALNDQTYRAFFTYGRVWRFSRMQIHIPRTQRHHFALTIVLNDNLDLSF